MNDVVYTRAVLITGQDEKGNEYTYWQVGDEWMDGYRETPVTAIHIANCVWNSIILIRFGSETMTRDEWIASGSPLEINGEQMQALRNRHLTIDAGRKISITEPPASVQVELAYGVHDLNGCDFLDLKRTQEDNRF